VPTDTISVSRAESKRKPRDERWEELLKVSAEVFFRKGYHGASLQEIADVQPHFEWPQARQVMQPSIITISYAPQDGQARTARRITACKPAGRISAPTPRLR
jgi:hypothetical protein